MHVLLKTKESVKMDGMLPLTRYYHSDKNDHFYQVETDEDILSSLEIGYIRDDKYEYQGVECYVFESERDDIAVIKAHNIELNEPRDMRKIPGELNDIVANNGESQILFSENEVTTTHKSNHGVYGFITAIMIIGVIASVLYFYGWTRGKALNEAESQPLLV